MTRDVQDRPTRARRGRAGVRRAADVALWCGAVLGVLSVLMVVVAVAFDVRPVVFRSGSMAPEIPAGSLALTRVVDADAVRVDDVVTVTTSQGDRVTHRVVDATPVDDGVSLVLKGDANAGTDPEPYVVQSVPRVVVDVPHLGRAVAATRSPGAAFAAGLLVAVVLVGLTRRTRTDRGGSHRAAVLLVVAGLGAGTLTIGRAESSWAVFTDSSVVTTGSLTALTVPPPTSPACSATSGNAVVSWTSAGPNYSYLVVVTRTATGAETFRTVVNGTSITMTSALLGNLLSTNFTTTVRAVPTGVNTWTSSGSVTQLFRSRALGLGTTCGNL